jgi:phosphomethylpyrimidine synthase
MLEVIEEQAQQGVDYMTIHAGVLIQYLPMVSKRITVLSAVVARSRPVDGLSPQQNFLYECFEDICKIFAKYDVASGTACVPLHATPVTKLNSPNSRRLAS